MVFIIWIRDRWNDCPILGVVESKEDVKKVLKEKGFEEGEEAKATPFEEEDAGLLCSWNGYQLNQEEKETVFLTESDNDSASLVFLLTHEDGEGGDWTNDYSLYVCDDVEEAIDYAELTWDCEHDRPEGDGCARCKKGEGQEGVNACRERFRGILREKHFYGVEADDEDGGWGGLWSFEIFVVSVSRFVEEKEKKELPNPGGIHEVSLPTPSKQTITLTAGEVAENHRGMEKIGTIAEDGFTVEELSLLSKTLEHAELIRLGENAAILVLRNGLTSLGVDKDALLSEQLSLPFDKKAFMYGRVVNKKARWNLCFDDVGHEADYASGKGTVIPFSDVPILSKLREALGTHFGKKAENLKFESNFYYDTETCGIGFHGDTERRRVIAVRLGETLPLVFQWFKDSKPISDQVRIDLHHGDVYVMSEKATGFDWKRKKIPTLRHAAGARKFWA